MATKKVIKKSASKSTPQKGKTILKKVEKKKKPIKAAASKKIVKKLEPKKKEVKKTIVKKIAKPKTKAKVKPEQKIKTKAKPKVEIKIKISAPKSAIKKAPIEKKLFVKKPAKHEIYVKKAEEIITPEMMAANRAAALKKIKGYSKKDLDQFRAVILEKRDEILEQLQNLREQILDPATGEYINENSPYSLHMAEQGTDAMEREKTFLYAQRENKFLGYLEDALKRIDNGTYGICVECIEVQQNLCPTCPLIPKERLMAVPHSQLCLPMKQKQEKK